MLKLSHAAHPRIGAGHRLKLAGPGNPERAMVVVTDPTRTRIGQRQSHLSGVCRRNVHHDTHRPGFETSPQGDTFRSHPHSVGQCIIDTTGRLVGVGVHRDEGAVRLDQGGQSPAPATCFCDRMHPAEQEGMMGHQQIGTRGHSIRNDVRARIHREHRCCHSGRRLPDDESDTIPVLRRRRVGAPVEQSEDL